VCVCVCVCVCVRFLTAAPGLAVFFVHMTARDRNENDMMSFYEAVEENGPTWEGQCCAGKVRNRGVVPGTYNTESSGPSNSEYVLVGLITASGAGGM
jgi:hypothetical protein